MKPWCVYIHVKAIKLFSCVVLLIMLYKLILTWMEPQCATIHFKASQLFFFFHAVLFTLLNKVVLTFAPLGVMRKG